MKLFKAVGVQKFNAEAKPCFANICEESCEVLKRKPYKHYHTENQGQKDIKILSFLQRQKIPQGNASDSESRTIFPHLETAKNQTFANENLGDEKPRIVTKNVLFLLLDQFKTNCEQPNSAPLSMFKKVKFFKYAKGHYW